MGQTEDKDVQYVNFKDSFATGGDYNRVKVEPKSIERFRNTVTAMFNVIGATAEGVEKEAAQQEVKEKEQETASNYSISTDERERKMNELHMIEDVLENVEVKTSITEVNRIYKIASRLLALTKDVLEKIATQAMDMEKLRVWKEDAKQAEKVTPALNKENPEPEAVQAAIDEVQSAFDSVLEKAREGKNKWSDEKLGSLFGGQTHQKEEQPEEPLKMAKSLSKAVESATNKKLEQSVVAEEPKEIPAEEIVSPYFLDHESMAMPVEYTYQESEPVETTSPELDDTDVFSSLPDTIAKSLKVDSDVIAALATLKAEQSRTSLLSSKTKDLISRRDSEEKKLVESEQERKEAEKSKAAAAAEATLHAKKTVLEEIAKRMQNVVDKNDEIEQNNRRIEDETVGLSEKIAENTQTAVQYRAEASDIRERIGTLDLTDLVNEIVPQTGNERVRGK